MKFLQTVAPSQVADLDYALFHDAVRLQDRFQLSYWDAAIVAATKRLGVTTLYSEDLNDGQDFEGVHVENPFRADFALAPD